MQQTQSNIYTPYTLPCGITLKNRLAKAAMEENMAGTDMQPDHALFSLYRYWAHGGLGMIITGNVMVDDRAITGPGTVVLPLVGSLDRFKRWSSVIKSGGAKAIMQLNHPGRQMPKSISCTALAPSAIPLKLGRYSKRFARPVAMTSEQIHDVTHRFAQAAKRAKEAGFDGVEIHAAHGYLLSQFLSPLSNQRQDEWGGSLKNRARLLLNVVCQVRAQCGNDFIVMVKLNSGDFQRGGLSSDEASVVVELLDKLNVDLLELSGGNYESPAMQGRGEKEAELGKNAYFLSFAKAISSRVAMPIMITGGITSKQMAEKAILDGCALVGMASALAFTPDLVKKWQQKDDYLGVHPTCDWKDDTLASLVVMAKVRRQLRRLGNDLTTMRHPTSLWSLMLDIRHRHKMISLYKKYLHKQNHHVAKPVRSVKRYVSSHVVSDVPSRDL